MGGLHRLPDPREHLGTDPFQVYFIPEGSAEGC